MAGFGMQGGSPLTHQRFGHVRMRHRGLLRGDRLDRPYLDGSARAGQCCPSLLAGAVQHPGPCIRLDLLHAMQFRPPPPPQVRELALSPRSSSSDRECPLDTAGDRCLWHAGGTAGKDDDARARRHSSPARHEGETRHG
jgi:hypothetical protein